jgi:hypothetical protein
MMGNRTTSLPSRESEGCRRTGAVVGHFLQSGLWAENRRLTGFSRRFQEMWGRFLCTSDCVAERAVWR